MTNMDRLMESLDRLEALKAANAQFYYILGEESNVRHYANKVRNDVIVALGGQAALDDAAFKAREIAPRLETL